MVRKLLVFAFFLIATIGAGGSLWLTWDYPEPMPATNIVFVILSSTNLQAGFTTWTNVAAPPVRIDPKRQEFFRAYASNTVSHLTSEMR